MDLIFNSYLGDYSEFQGSPLNMKPVCSYLFFSLIYLANPVFDDTAANRRLFTLGAKARPLSVGRTICFQEIMCQKFNFC